MSNVFLISEAHIKENSIINNNVDSCYILPAIQTAQDIGIQPIIGTKLYNKIMSLVEEGTITGATDYKVLLDDYIQPYLLNKVVADVQLPLQFKLRNQGVVQNATENTVTTSMRDIQYLIEDYNNKADFYANRLSAYLKANRSKYPEYCSIDSCADMRSNPSAYNTHIYLG